MDSRKKHLVARKENCVPFVIELLLKLRSLCIFFFHYVGVMVVFLCLFHCWAFFFHSDQIRDKTGFRGITLLSRYRRNV